MKANEPMCGLTPKLSKVRKGLRVRSNNVHPEVRRSVLKFTRWLRTIYDFPIRLPIYLSTAEMIVTSDKLGVSASFFAPVDKTTEPFIRVATGDFLKRRKIYGRDNAMAAILCSIAHEIAHYNQWLFDREFSEKEANKTARQILGSYSGIVLHP